MRVDLPAPFSPTRQWISWGATEKVTSLSAFTPGKVFVIFFISRMGVLMAAPDWRKWMTGVNARHPGNVLEKVSWFYRPVKRLAG